MQLNILEKTKKNFWLTFIFVAHLTFSYYYFQGWWYSAIGSGLIILFSYFIWKKDLLENIGLKINKTTFFFSIMLIIIVTISSYYISDYIAARHGIKISFTNWRNYFHDIFYTLNEEVILGSMLMFYCIKNYKVHPLILSAGVAILFSAIHFVFYKWIFLETGIIQPLTLVTLFVVGFMRNNLIITFGHIGYSWAFHCGWMAVMFGSNHFFMTSGHELTEPERFNTYLGSLEMLGIAIILTGATVWLYLTKNKSIGIGNR